MAQFTFNFTKAQRNALAQNGYLDKSFISWLANDLIKCPFLGARVGYQQSTDERIQLVYENGSFRLIALKYTQYLDALVQHQNKHRYSGLGAIPNFVRQNIFNSFSRPLNFQWDNVSTNDVEDFLHDLRNYMCDIKLSEEQLAAPMNNLFVHCGSNAFDINEFDPVTNRKTLNKPDCGFWACPVGEEYIQWKEYASDNGIIKGEYLNQSFTFRLADTAHVIKIETFQDLDQLSKYKNMIQYRAGTAPIEVYDYAQMALDGIDALVVIISRDVRVLEIFQGWDVDSLVVFNPGIIEVLDTKK